MTEPTAPGLELHIARAIVRSVAEEELPIFGMIADSYARDPALTLAGRGSDDELLGFDLDGLLVLVSPAVLAAVEETFRYLVQESARSGAGRLRRLLTRWHHDAAPSADAADTTDTTDAADAGQPAALTSEQLLAVKRIMLAKAAEAGVDEVTGEHLANACVVALLELG